MDLKVKDVAELLNVPEKTVRRWLLDGKIPAYRLNNQYRFSRIEIENWMMNVKQKPSKDKSGHPFDQKQIYPPTEKKKEPTPQRGGMQQYSLYRAIHKGGVFTQIAGETKEQIIRNTMKSIAPKFGLDDAMVSELLLDREKLMPTALSNGTAVPHTRDFLFKGPFDMIVVVFPKEPIEYGALDGKPVHTLFFLFSTADKKHLHLLAKLAHLSSSEAGLQFLKSKPNKKKLLDFILKWEAQVRQPSE
jgi:nitrogen PTS system EIIA component